MPTAQDDRERLVGLVVRVTVDDHVHRQRGHSRREGQRVALPNDVVFACGGRLVDASRTGPSTSCGLGALSVAVKSAVTVPVSPSRTVTSSIGDVRTVVVRDRPDGLCIAERRVDLTRQVDGERLVDLVDRVAVDDDRRRLGGLTRREHQLGRRHRGVVVACRRRAVGGRVVDEDGLAARRVQGHVEGDLSGVEVDALGDRGIADGDLRRRVVVVDRRLAVVVE